MSLLLRLTLMRIVFSILGMSLFGTMAYRLYVQNQHVELSKLLFHNLESSQRLIQSPEVGEPLIAHPQQSFYLQLVSQDEHVRLPLQETTPLPLYTEPSLDYSTGTPLLIASRPWLSADGVELGTIRLALDMSEALASRRALASGLWQLGIIIALGTTLFSIFVLWRMLRPLRLLAVSAKQIDPNNPSITAYRGPQDEVAAVANALEAALSNIRQQQAAERAALAEVAHELAAPLTLVTGHLNSLADKQRGDTHLEAARDAANELLYTSQDLLSLARGELEAPFEMRLFNLSEVAKRIAREYPGLEVQLADPIEVAGNPERMAQLIRNLVRNAVQASGSADKVRLELQQSNQQVVLNVCDQGPGIPPEDLPQLFERFYSKRGGTGVGLSVAQRIAQQHRGQLSVSSQLGEGSCFSLSLPCLDTQLSTAAR